MSEYIDERIVSIKFDNSGFAEGVSETQKQLDSLNKSLEFDGANEGTKELTKAFKDVSNEAKKTDLSPIRNAVENISDKFSALGGIATGVLFKIGSDAVDAGKRLIKSISIDPIAKGFDKYQQILSAQMTMIASLGGETEEEVKRNKEQIEDSMKILTWYADETSASLQDMLSNLSSFSKYGIDLDVATDAIMGIANAGFKAGIAIPQITHALEGFSKSIGQGFVSYQTWKTWIHSSGIDTVEFKNTFIDAAKQMLKEGAELGDGVRLLGDQLQYYAGKNEGWINVTAEAMENSLTKGKWLTNDVLMNGLTRYNAAMRDVYELTEQGARSVADLTDEEKALVDQTSLAAFLFGQQSKTLTEVTDAMQDAITTAWATIFKSLIGDYEQTVQIWSDMAEYVWEFFVIPLQNVSDMLEEFGKSTSNIFDETTGKFLTMREVIVGSIMNIFEAIKSVIDPIKEAFEVVFKPFETVPEKLQNGVESFYNFTKSLILTKDEAEKLRNKFIAVFNVLKTIGEVVKTVIDLVKKYVWPIIKKVASFAIKIIKVIGTALIKLISTISSFVSRVFGVRDIVADIKEDILSAAEAIDEMSESADDGSDSLDNFKSKLSDSDDSMKKYASDLSDVTDAMDDLTEAEEKNSKSSSKKEKDYTIPGGYDGTTYLSYYQAIEKANNKTLAEFIKEKGITEKQYEKVIEMLKKKDEGEAIYLSDMADASGLSISTMSELSKIIDQTTVAYDKSDKAISDILNKDAEAKKWETIWDGINEAQKATLITYGDEQAALQLYFKQGIKDYSEIAKMIGLEEWKVRRVISAYEEAYAVEELLAKQKKEVNADNIDAARQELGYITRKTEEKKKEQKLTERDKSIAERNARIQERNERLGIKTNRTTSNSVSVIGDAIRQIPIIGTAFDALTNVFGKTSKATTKSSESINKSIHSVKDYVDEIPFKKFITTRDNFYEVQESADDATKSIDKIAESGSKAEGSLKTSTGKMAEYFKDLDKIASDSSTSIEQSNKKVVPSSKSGSKNTSGGGSLAEEVGKIFGSKSKGGNGKSDGTGASTIKDKFDEIIERIKEAFINGFTYIKDKVVAKFTEIRDKAFSKLSELKNKSLKDIFEPLISKIKEIWPVISTTFSNISADLEGFFKAPAQTIGKVIEDIKNGFKNLFSKEDVASGLLGEETQNTFLASLDDMLAKAWEKIKGYFKNKAKEARNDEDNPFHGLVTAFDNIINWWDDFSYDITKYFNRIKEAINVVFGPGTVFEKLSSGILWRPFLEAVVNTIDKFDNISKGIDSIKEGIKNAAGILDQNFKTSLDNIIEKWEKIKDFFENFSTNLENAKAALSGGGGASGGGGGAASSSDEENGGLIGIIAKISLKWDNFKKKLEEGIDWDDIGKVSALELVLERIINAIANAWLRIGLAQMGMDIGNFFSSIADGFDSLAKAINREKDIGDILIKVASAIAILTIAAIALSSIDSTALGNATKAIEHLAEILVFVAASVTAVIGILRIATARAGGKEVKGGSVGEILAGGLSNLFGTKDTMTQAARLLVGIGAGILLLSAALAVIIDATKDLSVGEITKAMIVLVLLGGVLTGLLFAISKLIDAINGKGSTGMSGPGIAINLKNKEINKTVSSVGESLKGFALSLGVMIAGFVIITKVLEGVDSNWTVVAAFAILIAMIFSVIEFIKISTEQTKKLSEEEVDPKLFDSLAKIMKSLALGVATMVYGFKVLTDVIMNAMEENPDALMVAVPVFFGMIAVIGLFLFGVLAACRYLLGEKDDTSEFGGLFRKKGYHSKTEKVDASQVSDTLKSVAGLIVSLGFGVKLMAAAFKQVVEAVQTGMEDPLAFAAAAAAFVLILLSMTLMVIEITKAATKMPPGQEKVITAFAIMFAALGLAVKMIADAVGDLAKDLSKADTGAMIAAIAVVGVLMLVIGAIIAAFAVISAKGGGDSLMTAGKAFALIGAGLLAMAAAVYVLAKGIQEMVVAMSMVGSASDQMKSGLKTILDMIAEGIGFAMTALIQGFISGLEQTLDRSLALIEHAIMGIIAMMDKVLPAIAESLEKNREYIITIITDILEIIFTALNNALPEFAEWFNNLQEQVIYPALHRLLEWLVSDFLPGLIAALDQILGWLRDSLLPSLLDILQQILDFLIGEPDGVIYQIENAIQDFVVWLGDLGEEVVNSIAKIWAAVYVFITDTLFPDIEGLWQSLLDLLDQLIDDMLTFLQNGVNNWGNQIIDIIVDLINVIDTGRHKVIKALETFILHSVDDIISLFETGGTALARLLTIPAKVVGAVIKEFKNIWNGGSLFEQVFGDMGEGDSIEAKAGNMWERVEKIFTDKDHAGINEAEQISESAKKWGIYIANGVAKGLDTVPSDLQSNADSLWKAIKEAYDKAAGLNENGSANTSGASYKLGENTAKGILKGLKDFAKSKETKAAAEALWKEIDKQFRKSAKIKSPSKESYKWGKYIGMGLTNGLEKSSQDVGQAAIDMWETFYEPMEENIESFAAVTSSMLSQLLDANMDVNPVITPVFDMSNLDAASSSMSSFFDAQDALEVAGSFNGMQKSRMELENNQNEGDSATGSGPTYNYVQNNYSPKALSAIEIYRKTKNQLNFRTYAGG